MNPPLTFNDIILRLLNYWKEQGCLVWQPYNIQVGAGTMNPATVLRVLGPEPWQVVYVEPSIRPDDGRFGDNPNRMQQHYQLQVILKPDPGNPQELYLKSLEAIGIDPRQHDIRFVEDNWESPALGAWGLGWEVWLDGQEITQFTYFQQAGGFDLDPVSVEITYGLDRICLALQGKRSVWEMEYGAGVAYGDALLQAEIEHCHYYFHGADVEALRDVYETYENETKRCIAAGLVMPAHDYNLKCSHLFNVLDTRGAVSVTERAQFFKRMRTNAQQISDLYLKQREKLGYPLLKHGQQANAIPEQSLQPVVVSTTTPESAQTFLLEIGSEELPADNLTSAINQLKQNVPALLSNLRLQYDHIEVHGTPRRLAILVYGLADRQPDLEIEVKGPPAERAFDANGNPTAAAIGFAKGKGVDVAALYVVQEGKRSYVAATVHEAGRFTQELLAEKMPALIGGLKFERSMRWNQTNITYSRPLRWFVALYGAELIPFSYAGISSDYTSRGLRPYDSPPISISHADHYLHQLIQNNILLDPASRQTLIWEQATHLAQTKGGILRPDDKLLTEITNLVEAPTPFIGSFDEKHLSLPAEALVAVMKKHQRYFPIYAPNGQLLPYFIAVRNGDSQHLETVIDGNEQVIRARFADAHFFYQNDIQKPLTDFLPDLKKLTFQFELGSIWDKTQRLEKGIHLISQMLSLTPEETAIARRAATLSKADLATHLVIEMTSLQGIMGGHYAQRSGEPVAVALAIAEQYETISSNRPALALALTDRLDSLMGLFAVGLAPKGSNDPFALRRAAIQIIENLITNQLSFDLRAGLTNAAHQLPVNVSDKMEQEVLEFITGRLEVVLRDKGISTQIIKAVLAEQAHNPLAAYQTAVALAEAIQASDWETLLDAYARCVRITRPLKSMYALHPANFAHPAEQSLLAATQAAMEAADGSLAIFVDSLRQLQPIITHFFEAVLVMDENLAVRENRLALLQQIANLARGIADLSHLEGF